MPEVQRELLGFLSGAGLLMLLGLWAASEWARSEAFFDAHPEIKRRYEAWLKNPKPDPYVCPRHGLKIKPGTRCWVDHCDWTAPPKPKKPPR